MRRGRLENALPGEVTSLILTCRKSMPGSRKTLYHVGIYWLPSKGLKLGPGYIVQNEGIRPNF